METTPLPFQSEHFTVQQLAEGVFAAIATNGGAAISNAGIIELGGRTLVFDTFMTPQAGRDLRRAAQELTGREPQLVINSHFHNDHIWGNQAFSPDALFIATSQTLQLMHSAGRDEADWARDVSAKRLDEATEQYAAAEDELLKQDALLWMGYFGSLVQALPSLTIRFPDITFDRRLTLHGSSRSVELLEFSDSHTASDVILHLPQDGILFAADLLFVGCHPYLDEADTSRLSASLRQISGMGAAILVPGHGPLGTSQDIAANLDYIAMCTETAHDLVTQGNTSARDIARQRPPAPFDRWLLSRFFTANLASLCSRMVEQPSSIHSG